ncbi:hypothetical protein [Methylobacterium nigriterrae]|uniref:hypothetical protein n=1 Tax=Methylobacterium nigriterrae TaxID=3127512 RepID=UPI0030135FB8
MKSFLAVAVLAAVALGGCKTAAERLQAQDAADRATCSRLGAAPGSDREFQCKLTLETQRRNESAAYGAAQEAVAAQQRQQYFNQLMFGRR